MLAVFLLQVLHSLLLSLPLLLVQALQVLPSLVLLQHLVAFELLVSLGIIVLQVLGGLDKKPDRRLSPWNSLKLLIKRGFNTKQKLLAVCNNQSVRSAVLF